MWVIITVVLSTVHPSVGIALKKDLLIILKGMTTTIRTKSLKARFTKKEFCVVRKSLISKIVPIICKKKRVCNSLTSCKCPEDAALVRQYHNSPVRLAGALSGMQAIARAVGHLPLFQIVVVQQ